MGKKKKRNGPHFPLEAKRKAVEALERGDVKREELARDLGVSERSLHRWREQVEKADGVKPLDPEERKRLKKLEKENERLKLEIEILKKARTFSAKHRS